MGLSLGGNIGEEGVRVEHIAVPTVFDSFLHVMRLNFQADLERTRADLSASVSRESARSIEAFARAVTAVMRTTSANTEAISSLYRATTEASTLAAQREQARTVLLESLRSEVATLTREVASLRSTLKVPWWKRILGRSNQNGT